MVKKFNIEESWLRQRYTYDMASKIDIANEIGCSIHNIDRLLNKWNILRGVDVRIGRTPWNRGLNKNNDERLAKLSKDRVGFRNPMYGKKAWNYGLTVLTDERMKSMKEKTKNNIVSDETRAKQAAAKRGRYGKEANHYICGESIMRAGYIQVNTNGTRYYKHRYVVEKILGRLLNKNECIHHKDKNKKNNDLSNLLILSNSVHLKLHAAMRLDNNLNQILWLNDNNYEYIEIKCA